MSQISEKISVMNIWVWVGMFLAAQSEERKYISSWDIMSIALHTKHYCVSEVLIHASYKASMFTSIF